MDTGATLTAALLDVCRTLNGASVPYCLAGGLAVTMLTTPRATAYIDVVVSDNMATKTRRHEEIAALNIVCCAAAACCALTTIP